MAKGWVQSWLDSSLGGAGLGWRSVLRVLILTGNMTRAWTRKTRKSSDVNTRGMLPPPPHTHSKYSLCYSVSHPVPRGRGVSPSSSKGVYHHPVLTGLPTLKSWQGEPPSSSMGEILPSSPNGGNPILTWQEYPFLGTGWGSPPSPSETEWEYPPPPEGTWDQPWGTPRKDMEPVGWSIVGWRWVLPLGMDRQTPVKTVLPHSSGMRAVNISHRGGCV